MEGYINCGDKTNEELRQEGREEYRKELRQTIEFWERDLDDEDVNSHIWFGKFLGWIARIK